MSLKGKHSPHYETFVFSLQTLFLILEVSKVLFILFDYHFKRCLGVGLAELRLFLLDNFSNEVLSNSHSNLMLWLRKFHSMVALREEKKASLRPSPRRE